MDLEYWSWNLATVNFLVFSVLSCSKSLRTPVSNKKPLWQAVYWNLGRLMKPLGSVPKGNIPIWLSAATQASNEGEKVIQWQENTCSSRVKVPSTTAAPGMVVLPASNLKGGFTFLSLLVQESRKSWAHLPQRSNFRWLPLAFDSPRQKAEKLRSGLAPYRLSAG